MAEALCHDCNLGGIGSVWLESIRIDAGDSYDQELVYEQPNATALFAALKLPRPDRCQALRKELPTPPPKGPDLNPFARCPEVGLIALLYGEQMAEPFESE